METPDREPNDFISPSGKKSERDALDMVASALKVESYSATQLCLSMRVMIAAPRATIPLRQAVDKVVGNLSASDLKSMRSGLLKYYAITGDYGAAAKFLPKQGREQMSEYFPAVLVYLEQGKLRAAKSIVERCLAFVPVGKYSDDDLRKGDFIEHGLHVAIATYYARVGKRVEAIRFWRYTMPSDYLFAEAVACPIYARVVGALVDAHAAINALLKQQLNERFVFDQVAEKDALERRPQAIAGLQSLRDGLLNLLPVEQQRNFGVKFSGLRPVDSKEDQQ